MGISSVCTYALLLRIPGSLVGGLGSYWQLLVGESIH